MQFKNNYSIDIDYKLDRRVNLRWEVSTGVLIYKGEYLSGDVFWCRTYDLGMGGAALRTGASILSTSEDVVCVFELSADQSQTPCAIQSRIVRTQDDMVMLEFKDVSDETRQHLEKVCNASDLDVIES